MNKINKNEAKITNETFEFYKEGEKCYLRLDFDYENDFGIYKGHIDKIEFDLRLKEINCEDALFERKAYVKLYKPSIGYDQEISFKVCEDLIGELFNISLVKEKVCEMTIEEIEKKLGRKIKIVSRKFGE